ncbi:MAG: pyruvate ferredoxin oxidoreductase [Burkholderiaceae bacterium]|nr:MAG: pyruvate ferredoxin oxidoreductase [Burkholderiaceae bacterium]MBE7426966.1 pyruvate ferredoxin oxidoreductase [Ideonella sp.]MCC7284693.1 pyruvate ferredoxin oxidoreductase [Burkholderiaceae bacterium]
MSPNPSVVLLSGNHAVSNAVLLARPDVVPVYPITPQTPILERITELQSEGRLKTELLTPESEHSAMAACISASATGARVFTATSSQGLMLMHELLHYASGARTAIVMCNVNRTPAAPWGFWPDQTDSLAQRDTGWIQVYSESPQESLDSVLQLFRVAEEARVPAMLSHDAFYVSHALEPVSVPSQETVDAFLPPFQSEFSLDNALALSLGAPANQENWRRTRVDLDAAMARVPGLMREAGRLWGELTGRSYDLVEHYRSDGASVVLVTMGSMAGTVRDAVDALREEGIAAGMLKVRLFRPLPADALREALAGVPCAIVLDRNYSPGTGGVLHQELKSVLFGMANAPRVHGVLAGVGGVNVSPARIRRLVAEYRDRAAENGPVWME